MRQFVTFCAVGLANSALALTIIYALKWLFSSSDVIANLVGYAFGLTTSFFLNKALTFSHRGDLPGTAARFGAVQLVAYGLNLLTVLALIKVGVNSYGAQAAGIIPYAGVGFAGCKLFVFRMDRSRVSTAGVQG